MKKLLTSLFIGIFFFPNLASAALTNSLVSYWKLDESSGNAADSQSTNTLTNVNTVTYSAAKINNGANFVRTSSQYLSISDASQTGLDIASDMSIAFWMNVSATPATNVQYALVAKYNGGASQTSYLTRYRDAGGTKLFSLNINSGSSEVGVDWTETFNTSTWYYIVVTYTASTGTAELWINNVSQGTKTGLPTSINNSTAAFTIGSDAEAFNRFFNGTIDETGIWSKDLTSTEMTCLYNSGNGLAFGSFSTCGAVPTNNSGQSLISAFWIN